MIILIEIIVLCLFFTLGVCVMAKDPIKTLYNYPPKIQERVKSLKEYKGKIPTTKNMITTKLLASIIILIIVSLILRYINNCDSFLEAFLTGFIIWTSVNLYDCVVMDIIWFCHDKRFVFKGTEDMIKEYRNYWFHIKGSLIGEVIGTVVCLIASLIVAFIL